MATDTIASFTAFYDGWLLRHQRLQEQLQQAVTNHKHDELIKLIEQASNHYHQYYEEKTNAIEKDVFLIFSPPWYTQFERALFWVTGFRPSLLFRFVGDLGLTAAQAERVAAVREDKARKEAEIGEAMAMVQESLAAAPLYGLVNRAERLVDGEVSELDEAMEEVKAAMRAVVAEADGLRVRTVVGILEVLNLVQRVKFLAAAGEFRIRARRVGLAMDGAQGVTV